MNDFDLSLCQKMAGKSLLDMFVSISFDPAPSESENKKDMLKWINEELGANYSINHLNNYLSQRKPVPHRVQSVMRGAVLAYLFGDDVAEMLAGLC